MKISDNVVLITGGASGLGGATAKMVVEAGGKALIADVNAELGERFPPCLTGADAAHIGVQQPPEHEFDRKIIHLFFALGQILFIGVDPSLADMLADESRQYDVLVVGSGFVKAFAPHHQHPVDEGGLEFLFG